MKIYARWQNICGKVQSVATDVFNTFVRTIVFFIYEECELFSLLMRFKAFDDGQRAKVEDEADNNGNKPYK